MNIRLYLHHRSVLVGLLYASFIFAAPWLELQAWIGQKDWPLKLVSLAVVTSGNYVYVMGGKDKYGNPVDRLESLPLVVKN